MIWTWRFMKLEESIWSIRILSQTYTLLTNNEWKICNSKNRNNGTKITMWPAEAPIEIKKWLERCRAAAAGSQGQSPSPPDGNGSNSLLKTELWSWDTTQVSGRKTRRGGEMKRIRMRESLWPLTSLDFVSLLENRIKTSVFLLSVNCHSEENIISFVYMDTNNRNESLIRIKMLPVNTSHERFWSFRKNFYSEGEGWFCWSFFSSHVHT